MKIPARFLYLDKPAGPFTKRRPGSCKARSNNERERSREWGHVCKRAARWCVDYWRELMRTNKKLYLFYLALIVSNFNNNINLLSTDIQMFYKRKHFLGRYYRYLDF